MRKNMNIEFKKKLTSKVFGVFSKTIDPGVVESIGYSGMDFVILDQEHGNVPNHVLENLIRAAELSELMPIVRVSELNNNYISSALDLGAGGVQIPNISNANQVKDAIKFSKFHPIGERGVCRFVRSANYGTKDKKEYFADSNESVLIIQVEGQEGVNNIDEILAIEGFDVLFVGPYDLSQSLGVPGDVTNKIVLDAIKRISIKAKKKGVILGTFCDTIEMAKLMLSMGINYLSYSVDMNIYTNACKNIIEEIKE